MEWQVVIALIFLLGLLANLDHGTIVHDYACDCTPGSGYMPCQTKPPICGHCQQPMKEFHDE